MAKNTRQNYLRKNPQLFSQVLEKLWGHFPGVFNFHKPLAHDIFHQIRGEINIPSRDLHFFMGRYCSSEKYLTALTAGATRFDIKGRPSGAVTQDEASHAVDMLLRRYIKKANYKNEVVS